MKWLYRPCLLLQFRSLLFIVISLHLLLPVFFACAAFYDRFHSIQCKYVSFACVAFLKVVCLMADGKYWLIYCTFGIALPCLFAFQLSELDTVLVDV